MEWPCGEKFSQEVTLESVKRALNEWRGQRVRGQRIPKSLWQDIKSLTTAINYEGVASVLKIPPERLLRMAGLELDFAEESDKRTLSFAEVPFISFKEGPFESEEEHSSYHPKSQEIPILEMTRANGTLVRVQGLDTKDLMTLLQKLG